jgi:hypothetical protein
LNAPHQPIKTWAHVARDLLDDNPNFVADARSSAPKGSSTAGFVLALLVSVRRIC